MVAALIRLLGVIVGALVSGGATHLMKRRAEVRQPGSHDEKPSCAQEPRIRV